MVTFQYVLETGSVSPEVLKSTVQTGYGLPEVFQTGNKLPEMFKTGSMLDDEDDSLSIIVVIIGSLSPSLF